jgi:hypothetical protein
LADGATGGAISSAIAAVGAAIGAPNPPVLCPQPDSSPMDTMSGLCTPARENLDVTTVTEQQRCPTTSCASSPNASGPTSPAVAAGAAGAAVTIDGELRLLAAIRHTIPEEEGRTPSTARIDELLDETRHFT